MLLNSPKGGKMRVALVFQDLEKNGKSVYSTQKGVHLSMGSFHSGSTFSADLDLDDGQKRELREILAEGFTPVFWMYIEEEK